MAVVDEVRNLIEPWLAAERLELDDLELKGSGRGRTLRVVIDADGPLDLDRIAEVSGGIGRLLDAESEFSDPYQLEVTSPGLERALKTPRHFQKSVGREVSVKIRRDETTTTARGVLVSADDERALVDLDDGGELGFTYDEVVKARTVFTWQASPKPGTKSPKGGE